MATAVGEIDLLNPGDGLHGLGQCSDAMVLIRYAGEPLTQIRLPVTDGRITADTAWQTTTKTCSQALCEAIIRHQLGIADPDLPDDGRPATCTVVICTRDRTDDLRRCLDSLCPTLPQGADVLIVDNAPPDDATAELVRAYPVGYVVQPRKGLNAARQLGATRASGEIVIYTDDDVVVGPDWVRAMVAPFADPEVSAVTGAVLPLELQTPAQNRFEAYGGFGRGFMLERYSVENITPLAAAKVGAGANMAIRRELLLKLGLFEALLDSGTAAKSGGDTYAFYRLLACGHTVVYQPHAMVRHRHRRTDEELCSMLRGYSVGTFVYLLRCLIEHRELSAVPIGLRYLWDQHVWQLWRGLRGKPDANPLPMTFAEWRGVLEAPMAYVRTRRAERAMRREAA
jgi:GT2 family glycosyltransferase